MNKKIIILLFLSSCSQFGNQLVQDGDVFLYQNKEQIIVSFIDQNPSKQTLQDTGNIINYIWTHVPDTLQEENYFIEGLTGELFVDFMIIGDAFFLTSTMYHNKTLIYGYLSSLYFHYIQKIQNFAFIPINDLTVLFQNSAVPSKEFDSLLKTAVRFSLDSIFFVSILELLERQEKYFYPANTKSELYKVLIYPEILTFWQYMESRFGKDLLLTTAQTSYTPENFKVVFGEEIGDLESTYAKQIETFESSYLNNNKQLHEKYLNTLNLYLSGTKRSLMSK